MIFNLLILLCVLVLLPIWVILGILGLNHTGHQFPTSYQLLRESPEITRREWVAVRALMWLIVLFILLLITQLL